MTMQDGPGHGRVKGFCYKGCRSYVALRGHTVLDFGKIGGPGSVRPGIMTERGTYGTCVAC